MLVPWTAQAGQSGRTDYANGMERRSDGEQWPPLSWAFQSEAQLQQALLSRTLGCYSNVIIAKHHILRTLQSECMSSPPQRFHFAVTSFRVTKKKKKKKKKGEKRKKAQQLGTGIPATLPARTPQSSSLALLMTAVQWTPSTFSNLLVNASPFSLFLESNGWWFKLHLTYFLQVSFRHSNELTPRKRRCEQAVKYLFTTASTTSDTRGFKRVRQGLCAWLNRQLSCVFTGLFGVFLNTQLLNTLKQLSLLRMAASPTPAPLPSAGPKVSPAMRNELSCAFKQLNHCPCFTCRSF